MKKMTEQAGKKLMYAAAAVVIFLYVLLAGRSTLLVSHAETTVTVTTTSAKIRSEASTESAVVGSAANNTKLSVLSEVTGADGNIWYQVSVDGNKGYVRSDLVSKDGGEAPAAKEDSHTETSATVTESSISSGTVNSESVNIRKGPAKTDAVVGNVKKGATVSITGEAVGADGNTWYQVSNNGVTGFILSDLLDEGGEPAAPADDGEEEAGGEASDPEEGQEPAEGEEPQSGDSGASTEINNVISSRIIPGDADLEDMTIDAELLVEWESGNYYVLYTKDAGGGDSWYLYSLSDGKFERINSLQGGDGEDGESSGSSLLEGKSSIIMIVLGVVAVILIGVCIFLAIRLREYQSYYEDEDDDDDEEDEEDDEDDEEEEDDSHVNRKKWRPKNFLSRRDEYEDDDEEEEDDEEDDEEEDDDSEEETYLDDDDFEFEFLNLDGKGDIS